MKGIIVVSDARTGAELERISAADAIFAIRFSVDGSQLMAGDRNGTIEFLSIARRESIGSRSAHLNGISALALSPDGRLIASGGTDQLVKIWKYSR